MHICTIEDYAYVKNNPLKYLDAFGTTAINASQATQDAASGSYQWFSNDGVYTVGRVVNDFVYPGPKAGIGKLIEDNIPAAHTFGTVHDEMVDTLVGAKIPDIIINVPTMPIAFVTAVVIETTNSIVDGINFIFGTDIDIPFTHTH